VDELTTFRFYFLHGLLWENKTTPSISVFRFFRGFSAVPVFWSVTECSGVFRSVPVFRCSGVPVFLVLVHALICHYLLTIRHYSKLFVTIRDYSRSGESARLPPMCPGFDSWTRRHMWVEFVVCSRPCSESFSPGFSGFSGFSKTNISKFQFDREFESHGLISWRLLCVTLVKQSWFIILFIYSPLFATIHTLHYLRLFAVRYSLFETIRYSGFPDSRIFLVTHLISHGSLPQATVHCLVNWGIKDMSNHWWKVINLFWHEARFNSPQVSCSSVVNYL